MTQPSIPAPHSHQSLGHIRRFSKIAVALGVFAGVAGGAALHAAAGHMQGVLLDHAWRAAAARVDAPLAFGDRRAPGVGLRSTTVLGGISGEVFASPAMHAAADRAVAGAAEPGPLSNVSPAAWDRLSAGDCITVTTKSGQALSFRIVGARPAGEPKAAELLPKIDLAVTACTGAGEPIAKAVIEPVQQPAAQRAL